MTTHDPHKHEQRYYPARTETNDRCPARARLTWVLLRFCWEAPLALLGTLQPYHTHNHKATERRTADVTADGERNKARASRSDEDAV